MPLPSKGTRFQDPRAPQLNTGARSNINEYKPPETQSTSARPPPSLLQAFGASAAATSRVGSSSVNSGQDSEDLPGGSIRDKYLSKLRQKTAKANRGGVGPDGGAARRLVEQMDEGMYLEIGKQCISCNT